MPPEPRGAAAAALRRGESADGRARRAWVEGDGSRSATLGELLTAKNGEGSYALAALPLVHSAWLTAIVFSIVTALVLNGRIREENAALGYV
jgi:Isoprenylcysteine carboxyl methyltransferase (ICMT) family